MASNIPSELEDSVNDVLGGRNAVAIQRLMKLEIKQDRLDNKVVAFTEYRIVVLSAKVPSKVEINIPVLDLQAIESKRPNQLCLVTENRRLALSTLEADTEEVDHMITFIGTLIASCFYGVSLEKVIAKVEIQPSDRRIQIQENIMLRSPKEPGPCGGFTPAYGAMCDYHGVLFMDDVAWDVDTIYLSHDSRELNLADFDHLDSRHMLPIIAALEFNTWFTKLNCSNVKLSSEAANEILHVMKKNTTLQELWLSGMGVRWEFVQKLSMALLSNTGSPLSHVDLSNNSIEDRGLGHLCQPISKLSSGLVHLNLSKTGITSKGVNRLGEALAANRSMPRTLHTLNLSHNNLKGEELTNLYLFLSQPNALKTLNLSNCDCALDSLFSHLLKGCHGNLEHADLSNNVFTHKRSKEGMVPLSWKQYFSSSNSLKHINMSSCKLPADAVKSLLLGLGSNQTLKAVEVDVSGNDLRSSGAQIIENCIPNVSNISALNIADNNFDLDIPTLCQALSRNQSLKKLSIGRNFNNIKPKHLPSVLGAIVQLIQEEDSGLESLSIADSKLRTETTIIINALGSNSTLTDVDISGNLMGDIGARMLAKALMINTKLRTIHWDRNNTSAQGFQDLASALQKNFVVQTMPTPLSDAMSASKLNPEKTEAALQTIENVLQRNHSPRKLATDQAYRLHQGFLISSSQQMLSRLMEQVEDQLRRLEKGAPANAKSDITKATNLVKDANKSKLVLSKLQEVVSRSEEESSAVDGRLRDMTADLHTLINNTIQKNTSDMLKCAEDQCPSVLEDKAVQKEIRASCSEKATLHQEFTHSLIMQSVRTDVINKVSELNLAVATCMSDRLIDNVLDSLDASHKKLINHVNTKLSSPTEETVSVVTPVKPAARPENGAVICAEDPQSTLKRKSLYSRRLRPQSVIDANEVKKALVMSDVPLGDSTTDEMREEEEEPHANELNKSANHSPASGKGQDDESDGMRVDTKGGLDLPPLSPIPQSPVTPVSTATTPSSIEALSPVTSKAKPVSTKDVLGDLPKLETEPKLEHLGRDRPRRPKTRAVSKAVFRTGKSIEDEEAAVDEGLGDFFTKRSVSKEHVVPDKTTDKTTQRENEINKEKNSEDHGKSDKKKGWSPFGGGKPNTKGLAEGISNFFKKDKSSPTSSVKSPELGKKTGGSSASPEPSRRYSDKRSPTDGPARRSPTDGPARRSPTDAPAPRHVTAGDGKVRSPEVRRKGGSTPEPQRRPTPASRRSPARELEETSKSEDEEKKDKSEDELEDEVPAPKKPVGIPMMGMGSGTSAILAEMKAKRATVKQPTDQKKDENKENQGVTAPRPVSSILRPKPAPRSASPNTQKDKDEKSEKIEDVGGRVKPPPPTRPKPPPVAPKPRASMAPKPAPPSANRNSNVPASGAPNSSSPSTRIQSGLAGRMSDSIDHDKLPPEPAPDSPPPERATYKRRLSIKDRIAALPLEANNNTTTGSSNEQSSDAPNKKSSTLPPMSSAKYTEHL